MSERDDNTEQAYHVTQLAPFEVPFWAKTGDPDAMKEAAQWVLFYFMGPTEGTQSGSFTTPLIQALASADPTNWAKVYREYPELAACVRLYKSVDGGLEYLRRLTTL